MTVLSYTNAFPGIPAPQHLSGQSSVQNYLFPGALQPLATGPAVLSYTKAFPGIPAPQHLSGQSSVQSFLYPGALQPLQAAIRGAGYPTKWNIQITIG
jgi:hypothetical protein